MVTILGAAFSQALAHNTAAPLLVDCTLGCGGHSAALLAAFPTLRVVGVDRDPKVSCEEWGAGSVCQLQEGPMLWQLRTHGGPHGQHSHAVAFPTAGAYG